MKNKFVLSAIAASAALSLLFVSACRKGDDSASPARKPGSPMDKSRIQYPVEAAPVGVQSLVFSVGAVGSVDAFEKVQVTARVAGVVDRVLFAEGRQAEVSQVLVEIEPERFKLAVESAQASHDRALASKADAEAGLKRRETVITQNPGLIPGEEVETWRTKVLLASADVAQTLSALNQAKLNLRDAYVRAPFAGIIQTRTVQTGQYVQVGTVLATLIRRDPLLLRFRVPQREAAQMRTGMTANFKVRDNPVDFEATIVHIAAAADEAARMVDITAHVKNSGDGGLRPGTFAEITIPVSSARTVPMVPQTAIRPSEKGFIAYVVENGMAVERILTIGMQTADGKAEVISGIQPGEMLVVRGSEALRPGAPVRVIPPASEGTNPAAAAESDPAAPAKKTPSKPVEKR